MPRNFLSVAMYTTAIALSGAAPAFAGPPSDEREVLDLLGGEEFKEDRQKLVAWGAEAFPIYLGILEHKECTAMEKSRIFSVLRSVKADRSRFLEAVVSALAHENWSLRSSAVQLVAQIGTAKDASPVVALLSDGVEPAYQSNCHFAAKTLAAIGGPREVIAMDAWLLGVSYADDKPLRTHVKKCRDELAARLAKEPKK